MEILAPRTTSAVDRPLVEQTLEWLALGLSPGLGPTRADRLVEHFGNLAALSRAFLAELEVTGLLAVSAQSLGTGKSIELPQQEMGRAKASGVQVLTLDDPAYPPHLRDLRSAAAGALRPRRRARSFATGARRFQRHGARA